jgi:PLP dependent protein
MALTDDIREKFIHTQEEIGLAARRSGRDPAEVKLVVVSKAQPVEVIEAALAAGIRVFGENYPEETVQKIACIQPPEGLEWHMIGHLQSRKARLVVESFHYLHSLDSFHLAEKLASFLKPVGKRLPVLLELNISGEETKSGWPAWEDKHLQDLVAEFERIGLLPHLQVKGLMTMPPFLDDPVKTRPYFVRLRNVRDYLRVNLPGLDWSELSMGTSLDYAVAVEEGATFVRVGQAILGPRQPRKV